MAWEIELSDLAIRNLDKLNPMQAQRIVRFLLERVSQLEDPRSIGEALKGSKLGDLWKYRVGDFRIIADIRDKAVRVVIVRVGNRKEIYRR